MADSCPQMPQVSSPSNSSQRRTVGWGGARGGGERGAMATKGVKGRWKEGRRLGVRPKQRIHAGILPVYCHALLQHPSKASTVDASTCLNVPAPTIPLCRTRSTVSSVAFVERGKDLHMIVHKMHMRIQPHPSKAPVTDVSTRHFRPGTVFCTRERGALVLRWFRRRRNELYFW